MSIEDQGTTYVLGGNSAENFSGSAYFLSKSLQQHECRMRVVGIPLQSNRNLMLALLHSILNYKADTRKFFFLTEEYQNLNLIRSGVKFRANDVFISFNQILPSFSRKQENGFRKIIYTDLVLSSYMEYALFDGVPKKSKDRLFLLERNSYQRANHIFVFEERTKQELVLKYGVLPDKISAIGRGINLPEDLASSNGLTSCHDGKIKICFIGVDFVRKGLIDLVNAIDIDVGLQSRVEVHVIGPRRCDIPDRDYLIKHGYLDKINEIGAIIKIIRACNVGYLFSKAEGIPGAVLEFLALGLPCIISDIPALNQFKNSPGIIQLPLAGGAKNVSTQVRLLVDNPDILIGLAHEATQTYKNTGWDQQASAIVKYLHSGE